MSNTGVRVPLPRAVRNPPIPLQSVSISVVPHPRTPPTTEHVVLQYVFIEKNMHIREPAQFKSMLFKGQLERESKRERDRVRERERERDLF